MDVSTLVHLPIYISSRFFKRAGGLRNHGTGLAVCTDLGLLVISSSGKLQVFALPEDIARDYGVPRELVHVRTLGGVAPMEFGFYNNSGYMAFTDGCGEAIFNRLLLVTDTGRGVSDAVHVVDVVRGTHLGYVAAPGTIMSPRGSATRKSLAAVSCWESEPGNDVVRVFECNCGTWTAVRTIAVAATGLRFTADGLGLVVPRSISAVACAYSA
jgi:hypothetical protein